MPLKGKGFYIWKIKNCEGGDAAQIAKIAKNAGLSHVLIKVANGIYSYNYDWTSKIDLVPPVARALKSAGVQVWGWHYVYGNQPVSEARIAIRRVAELDLDGYVIDAESEYKESGKAAAARKFMQQLTAGLDSSVPVALTSYRFPSLHPIPWNEFLKHCDYNMPQVYWMQAHNPGAQLAQTLREYESPNIKYRPPIFPVGAAFREHGWEPTKNEVVEFLDTSCALNLGGANFWEWYACREVLKPKNELWNAISTYNWDTGSEIPKDITEKYVDALNSHNPDKVSALYHDRAVHVTSARTIFGKPAIKTWYGSFLKDLLPNAQYTRTGFSGTGNSRHFTWNAKSPHHKVLNGNDTFGLADGKITYHYTFFTLS
jgi:hypothetical protein